MGARNWLSSVGINPSFTKLWAAAAASHLGDGIWLLAAPLLATTLTKDPLLIAGIGFAQRLPWLLFGLVGGALADRVDRRRAMVLVVLIRASLVGGLGIAVMFGFVTLTMLYVVFFLIATGETLFDTSASAILPAVVPKDDLTNANARLAGTMTTANQFAGPPLGGLLFSLAPSLPFFTGTAGLLAAASLIFSLRGDFRAAREEGAVKRNLRTDIAEGVKWLCHHRLLRVIALSMGLLNITVVAQVAIMVLYAEEWLGLGAKGYGVLVTLYGVGGVLGSFVAGRVLARTGQSLYLRLAIIFEAAIPLAMALTHQPLVAGFVLALFGFHAVIWGTLLTTLRQELTPDHLRGRISGVTNVIEYGTAALGAVLGGILAEHIGLTAPFWLGTICGVLLLPMVWGVFSTASIAAARNQSDTV